MAIFVEGLIEQEWSVPIPRPLNDWIHIRTKVYLDKRIRDLFSECCYGVQAKITKDRIANKNYYVIILFDAHGEICLKTTGGKFLGTQFSMIIYPVQDWLDENLSDQIIALSIIEEMCHYFWSISDEWEVQKYVVDAYKRAFPKWKAVYPYKDRNTLQLLPEFLYSK